eukprot:s13_g20.t1
MALGCLHRLKSKIYDAERAKMFANALAIHPSEGAKADCQNPRVWAETSTLKGSCGHPKGGRQKRGSSQSCFRKPAPAEPERISGPGGWWFLSIELCQKEEALNGEIAAASARAKEQLNNEIRKVTTEVQQMWQQSHHAEQILKEEVLQLTHGMRKAEEEAEELRAEVHEACTAIEENRQEVDAHLSLRISEVQQSLQAEFKVADANLHTEVATAAANDRYNLGVEMERLRGDLGQVELLRSSELASRAGAHEVIATLRVEQLFSPAPAACDYEFPLLASRCMVRLKPNRKALAAVTMVHQPASQIQRSESDQRGKIENAGLKRVTPFAAPMAPMAMVEDSREGERPQVPYSVEVASYAEIFQEGEPYLLDLFAATCWDAGETPTVETAHQFWETLGHAQCSIVAPVLVLASVALAVFSFGDAFVAAPQAVETRALQHQAASAMMGATLAAAASPLPALAARVEEEDEGFDLRILAVLALPLFAVSWALFNVWRVAFRQVVRIGESEKGNPL